MISILPLEKDDAELIVKWNEGTTSDFLQQWTGHGFEFPITESQIINRIDNESTSDYKLYKILLEDTVIGTIELLYIDEEKKYAHFGRFLLNPLYTGKGHGTAALNEFACKVFDEFNINTLGLTVFDYNNSAIRCYEKAGFKVVDEQIRLNGLVAIRMVKTNPRI